MKAATQSLVRKAHFLGAKIKKLRKDIKDLKKDDKKIKDKLKS